eukprot:scaffold149717_cov86-Attheya_sp.AAC.1
MWTSGGSVNIGSDTASLTQDYKDYDHGWQLDFDCLAIARHDTSDFSGVKVWKMKAIDGFTKFKDYFAPGQDESNLIVTANGPSQVTIKTGAADVDEDPILASSASLETNNLAFNWKYLDNGVRVVLTDVGHHSGTLTTSDNDDDNHGLGNTFSITSPTAWTHDASVIQ